MDSKTSTRQRVASDPDVRASARLACAVLLVVSGLMVAGCTDTEEKPPVAQVKTVDAYGVTLDPSATPQQVVYVLLRSIVDDYAAARAKDAKAQRKAQEVTFSLAAPAIVEERQVQTANQLNPDIHKTDLGADRDEKLFKTVHYWAPIVGHYLASFRNVDVPTLMRDSWLTISGDGRTAELYYPVSHDPAETDPAKAETATVKIELNREPGQAGGPEYWRVSRVRFLGRQFVAPAAPQGVQAYGLMLDESGTPEQVAAVLLRSVAEVARAEKAGAQDVYASALYRVYCLVNPAQVQARVGPTANSLAVVIQAWAKQVGPMAEAVTQANAGPQQMRAAISPGGDVAQVSCVVPGRGQTVDMELARQTADGKTYWRAAGLSVAGGQAGPTTQPAVGSGPAR